MNLRGGGQSQDGTAQQGGAGNASPGGGIVRTGTGGPRNESPLGGRSAII
jgi:hypothetical protein